MRHSSRRLGCFVAAASAILALALAAPAANNTLEVKCVDQAGIPISSVKVQLQQLIVNKGKDKKTDSAGIAQFTKLDDGIYRVVGRKDGLAPAFHEYIQLKDDAQQSVTLQFEPGVPESKLYFEGDPSASQRAFDFLSQGVKAIQDQKFEEAEKLIQESLRVNPSNPETLFNLAIAQVQMRKWDVATETFQRVNQTVDIIIQLQRAAGQADTSPLEQMQERSEMLIRLVPAFRLRGEGDQAAAADNFDEAIAKYQEALKIDQQDPDLYYNLALAQGKAGKYDDALASADKAVQMKPGEAQYRELKNKIADLKENALLVKARGILEEGDKLYNSGDFEGALKKYEEARPMIAEEKQAGIWVQEGRTYAKLKQADQAVAAFNKAIELAPDNGDYRKALAQYYMAEKRYDDALNVYADPRTTGSTPPDQALFALGQSLSNQGNGEVAELAFEKVLKINPQHAEAHYELGMALYYTKKNDQRAKELLTKFTEIGKDPAKLDNAKTVLVVIKKRSP